MSERSSCATALIVYASVARTNQLQHPYCWKDGERYGGGRDGERRGLGKGEEALTNAQHEHGEGHASDDVLDEILLASADHG